ncbi:helix-turn-helix transcriptional regulator [Rhizobium sp. TRM95796]|uniref:helix-turn-helix transcriptional regulator n=1 Tax=Rhizobium sp. TRM95796 TaxID=2979862 RepID=UPI0021E7165F|nr:AraC family transcriptional regulator [Rhizobium sp. TRM95796]MCV3765844.1 AraC family transcriptional regulator [Rhizobium sp. TRM95796]
MSALQFQIDDSLHRAPGGAASPASQHNHLTRLLAHVMSLVAQDDDTAIDLIRKASALVASPDLPANPARLMRGGLAPWQVSRVRRHIDEELTGRINIDDLAQITRLSTSYFSAAFRASFGTSPHDYICRRRIDHAKQLMLTTDTPLCEIALDCGFADQSHLCRVFRRVTGQTPAAWRRNGWIA